MTSDTSFLQSVLITGCSAGGIGSALAETFHERGLYVFATARSKSKMTHLEKLPNLTLLELDVTSPESIAAAVAAVTAKTGGKLDYLVNNSGQSLVKPVLDTDINEAKKLFDVNVWGVVAMTQAFAPLVIAAKGGVVNLASLAAYFRGPWLSLFALTSSNTLRLEMAPFGVKVVTVAAGTVETNIFRRSEESILPPGSMYKPAEKEIQGFADGSLINAAMPPAEFATKVVNDVLGGATGTIWRGKFATVGWFIFSFLPTWLIDRITFPSSGLGKLH
ncbi:hypothetical protein BBP40_009061 [Aspergillus hancockii]|nr:hypothetical protein BBP40_009061 [Aspergillus hancockii]